MHSRLDRRTFLRASGVSIALPLFGGMKESRLLADERSSETKDVRRMLAICAPLGMHTPNLFPKTSGRDYEITPYLKPMEALRDKFTVISGLMHPNVDGGHLAEKSFLTGAAHPGQPSFQNTISVDQLAAEQIGYKTRFASLTLSTEFTSLSYTRSGVQIPAERSPAKLFTKLFLEGTKQEKEQQMRRIEDGQSIMDLVQDQTRKITKQVGREDSRTLDQYLTSVRELEQRLVLAEDWANRPKPHVDRKTPVDTSDRTLLTERMGLMYEMIFLAIQTDSTRMITFMSPGENEVVHLKGVSDGWHNLSHHGRDPNKIEMLSIIELEEMRLLADLLQKLDDAKEGDHSLLDQTAVLFGSNLGNASSHNNTNLPILAAGGHFRHGQHLAYGNEAKAPPLCNLLVSYLQHLGLEIDQFSSGNGTLTGLETV
ncbi:DUF1552 domain-containing protein [Blastopirellula marina]|uniref:DUF1552 domain-containing protein n=1 Tax=Blastopirellula marina TaxID=124 RepID=A0A2S8G1W8_9BACT|nr:DUF1552 domain-containing protein [Blastopirellula marina]PQO38436.1 hypothetical protein C5Y98_10270 [Blastopirellula marina]PTL45093.1 DUF1552 domain-containing protein [Blastopirellula marina]